ncbi:MAG TPA: tRNA epoxyqueuosine(34) reductase QueG [Gemmatimonadales bacterium]
MRDDSGPATRDLAAYAAGLGFLACGVASLEPSRRGEALDDWLARGYGGTMRSLHRGAAKRKRPGELVPGAMVAVVVLENYLPAGSQGAAEPGRRGIRIAKYALGEDYHRTLKRRLESLADWLRARGARVAHPWTDDGPVPERELAERAGLGWIGKNTMLIHPQSGSFCFIGAVFTDLPLESTSAEGTDRCGICTRCLDACPTAALVAPRVLDATRCISFLTIESRQPIAGALAERLSGWAFGCDICNDVCPWNVRFAEPTPLAEYQDRGVIPDGDPAFFERMTQAEFDAKFGDTPLARPGLAGMRRNWAAATRSLRTGSPFHAANR